MGQKLFGINLQRVLTSVLVTMAIIMLINRVPFLKALVYGAR